MHSTGPVQCLAVTSELCFSEDDYVDQEGKAESFQIVNTRQL